MRVEAPAPEGAAAVPAAPALEAFFSDKKGRPVALAVLDGPVADSHTHLSSLRHIDPALALARA